MLNGKPDHGFLFMGSKAKKPMDVDNMCYYIVGIFDSTIGLKLSPHKLRNIYCTYLADSNADQQTIASSAYWMRHSPEMARKVYTKQSIENKLRPGAERITAINSKFL